MKNDYFLKWTRSAFYLLLLLAGLNTSAQSFLIGFPNNTTSPTQNPQNLVVSNGSSLLRVRLDVAHASTSGAEVTIQLPPGVEYVAGSVNKVGGTAALTIADSGGTANAPQFVVGPANLAIAEYVEFTILRKATCSARIAVLNGQIFSDAVTGTITGATPSTSSSGTYQVTYPVFSFSQPATQTNAILNTVYNRTFTINNGGNGSASEVYFSIDGGTASITNSVTITSGSVVTGAPITLTPTSTVGSISYYTIPAANLSGGSFGFGENIVVTENYTVKQCNATTNYTVGWGDAAAPASWCQTVSGAGSVAMATGVPNLSLSFTRVTAGDFCTGDTWRYTYTNNGTENTPGAATAFNIVAKFGTGIWSAPTSFLERKNAYLENFTINGVPINFNVRVSGSDVAGWTLNLSDAVLNSVLSSDPDGPGGLTDADGDGQYDDLPKGATLVITYDMK